MHIPARADALHDFLPDVAALIKVQSTLLLGFLGQVTLADILSVAGKSQGNSVDFQRLTTDRNRTSRFKGLD